MVNSYSILAITNSFAVIIQFVFNSFSNTGPDGVIFHNTTGAVSDKYRTEITPAGWTFIIWGFIYTWQALWVIYSLINICRKGSKGQPAYLDPQFLPNTLFIISIIVCVLNIVWLISFDREEMELATTALIAYSILQYTMMFLVYLSLDKASPKLVEEGRANDIWLTRGLVLNGIGIQATWVSIATLLNIQVVMIYRGEQAVSIEDAATFALSLLFVLILVFAVSDLLFLDRYSRYTITPYIVLVVALTGSISKNWDSEKRNSIFSAILLALCLTLLLVKLVVTVYKHFTKPRYQTAYSNTMDSRSNLNIVDK